ncbi:diacylglycerol O-acyltransferase 2-like [Episyrphus balteatus]|uniref:diacylglycerol O-acyltransferase 2-like n=1 Tax=Episyrphus balteatus TaxID=286459 RepID=UPI002486953F|nr:diacylglycerol O-acyltransferase 2-like [Episyrphus balteatus]
MSKIVWAPINVPLRRRIQTFTTAVYMLLVVFGNYYLKALLIAYGIWIYFDREKSENEVRGSGLRWMRDNFFWKHFRDYFPVELVKTEELPPNKNYLLACYPHGVTSIGGFINIVVDISKWDELFPKVRPIGATMAFQFSTPFWRHIVKLWGLISVTKKSLLNNLTTSNDPNDPINAADGYTASAVAVAVGGAKEALDSKPGKYIITIKDRKGFIKVAMQTGAAIVPVFSFGEVDVFDQLDNPPNSFVRNMQLLVKKVTGISPLIILGRGFFQYNIGMLPQRRRIVQVVGAPIDVPKSDDPKKEDVEKYHQKFMDDLNALFETHKAKYIPESEKTFLVMT